MPPVLACCARGSNCSDPTHGPGPRRGWNTSHPLAGPGTPYDDVGMSLDAAATLFTAIDHVGIAVPDLDAAIAFYEESYGMRLAHQEARWVQ